MKNGSRGDRRGLLSLLSLAGANVHRGVTRLLDLGILREYVIRNDCWLVPCRRDLRDKVIKLLIGLKLEEWYSISR